MKANLIAACALALALPAMAKTYTVTSPDKRLSVAVDAGPGLTWSISRDGTEAMAPSAINLMLADGRTAAGSARVTRTHRKSTDTEFATPLYRKTSVADRYNELSLDLRGGYTLQVRAYDDAAAYRFVLHQKDSVDIAAEHAEFRFGGKHKAWLPLINDLRDQAYPFAFSFESYYDEMPLADMPADTLSCTPLLVELDGGRKALVMEGALSSYPGMFLRRSDGGDALQSVHAPLPVADKVGGFNRLNLIPTADAGIIARVAGDAALPWRAVAITDSDTQLPDIDLAMRLAEPSRLTDTSWIRPGKVAWDWWNDWGLTGVDFEAGINTDTYKHYIDFAGRKGLEYVILDEGWARDNGDLLDINPDIDLSEIIRYAGERGVGIVLWATWRQLKDDYPSLLGRFADMGVKGFKVDFFDRDDQEVIESIERIAQCAAEHHLLLDLHGFRPIGLHRTYPNIVNYEGVKGLENYKWGRFADAGQPDQLRYDVTVPFIRMAAGPLDYTPGAMTNSTLASYRPSNDAPMSLGTRAHQVAMYVVYDGALQMLADSPTAYDREPDCSDFMAAIPTVWDETRVLEGSVGEYVAIARRKGDTWYVAAMTNASPRTLSLPTDFLAPGTEYTVAALADGINAAKHPTDYRIDRSTLSGGDTMTVRLAPGGGYTAVVTRK
ncbi:MAG: glycoside hydrolase family 97 protein [Muribaculaceae bacterium]|nr:glycoside hydrolase family 97 protein [Muribaculaceae bacterium]